MSHHTNIENEHTHSLGMPEARMKPTEELNRQFQELYDLLNDRLFAGSLVPCMVVFSRRKSNHYGYYRRIGWKKREDKRAVPEICLNSELILDNEKDELEVIQTLVHEMCHHWQYTDPDGKPSRTGYHNKQFAWKMQQVGLHASATGKPGGAETGQSMLDYVIVGGPLDLLYKELKASGWAISYVNDNLFRTIQSPAQASPVTPSTSSAPITTPAPKPRKNKVKYSCPSCGINVWGKPLLRIGCLACNVPFQAIQA